LTDHTTDDINAYRLVNDIREQVELNSINLEGLMGLLMPRSFISMMFIFQAIAFEKLI
jgi:hypothetical protein